MSKLGFVVAAALSAAAMSIAYAAWTTMADVTMSTVGYVVMILGAVVTAALGAGLMSLMFWSNRKGFDDRAGARPAIEGRKSPAKK